MQLSTAPEIDAMRPAIEVTRRQFSQTDEDREQRSFAYGTLVVSSVV